MENKPLITVKNLRKHYVNKESKKVIFKDLSLTIYANKFYCIVGPSGSGKTTLLNILANLIPYNKGTIKYNGSSKNEIKTGFVFQNDRLLPWRTVYGNLDIVLEPTIKHKNERSQIIRKYLKKVGMISKIDSFPNNLSGGERQRINLIRALVVNPDVIFMDEPFSHLDELTATKLRIELLKLWEEQPKTVVMVTHNIIEAIYLADEIYVVDPRSKSNFDRIKVDISRPRSHEFLTNFVFNKKTQKLIKIIQDKLFVVPK